MKKMEARKSRIVLIFFAVVIVSIIIFQDKLESWWYKGEYAARVEDIFITHGEVRQAIGQYGGKISREKVLSQLIAEKLLLQAMETADVVITDEDYAQFLVQEAAGQNLSVSELAMLLPDKEEIKIQLRIAKYINATLLNGITVSDGETKAYYDNNTAEFLLPEQAHAAHILVRVQGKTEQQLDGVLQKVLDASAKGVPFAALAQKYSEDPETRGMGGDLGYIYKGWSSSPELDKIAFSLPINTTSKTFRTKSGFHVLTVYDRVPERQLSYEEVKDRLHLLLLGQKQKAAFESHLAELESAADVRVYE